MWRRDAIIYLSVSLGFFLVMLIIGKVFKKGTLGNGVTLGIENSLLLSILWPITTVCIFFGMIGDLGKIWRKL